MNLKVDVQHYKSVINKRHFSKKEKKNIFLKPTFEKQPCAHKRPPL